MVIVGVKTVEYEFAGKKRSGFEVYLEYEKNGVDGLACASAWLSQSICKQCSYMPVVGDVVKAKFEHHGNNRISLKWIQPV